MNIASGVAHGSEKTNGLDVVKFAHREQNDRSLHELALSSNRITGSTLLHPPGRTKRQAANENILDLSTPQVGVNWYIGFRLDGVLDYVDLASNSDASIQQLAEMSIVRTPVISVWSAIRSYEEGVDLTIEVGINYHWEGMAAVCPVYSVC